MHFRKISQKFRDIHRLNKILRILTKHGFGFAIQQLHLEGYAIGRSIIKTRILGHYTVQTETRATRLRKVLEELGPTFIKFGQILSVRPDLIPPDFCDELGKLQDSVPPFDYEDVKKQIKDSLGSSPDVLFKEFDTAPLAAASLGQVHRAKLLSGENVVVKVQRPDLKKVIETDIDILYTLAQLANRYMQDIRTLDPVTIIDEFAKVILKELDFTYEAHNIDKFRKNFAGSTAVKIPRVFWDYTKPKVVTSEEIVGMRMNEYLGQAHSSEEKKLVAANGAKAIFQQILIDGFYHADLHPGNIFVLSDNTVAFVDFGIVGKLDEETRRAIVDLLIAVSAKNTHGILKVLEFLGAIEEKDSAREFKSDINDFLDRYYGIPLKQIELSILFGQAINLMIRHEIKVPTQFHILFKAVTTMEGVARQLDPEFNMVSYAKPYVEKLVREKYDPKRIFKDVEFFSSELLDILKVIPKDAYEILKKIKKGSLKIEFEHQGLSKFISEMDKSSNRISFSLVISALIIGSSLIVMANRGPLVYGFSVLGVIGFVFAGILGLGLAIGILKSGRL
ncbi:MAG: AarF/ABC1/UbiB kinase family protein [Candidatus Brocadiaceae bacterium]|nr:AarF/ABC1/UbiB kinase family protein [Candidatus Brocadiaceae bacterium]